VKKTERKQIQLIFSHSVFLPSFSPFLSVRFQFFSFVRKCRFFLHCYTRIKVNVRLIFLICKPVLCPRCLCQLLTGTTVAPVLFWIRMELNPNVTWAFRFFFHSFLSTSLLADISLETGI